MSSQSRSTSHVSGNSRSNPAFDEAATRTVSPIVSPGGSSAGGGVPVHIEGDMLDLGFVFDEFELIRYIGGGGMGDVWLAQDANLNRLVALKVLHSDKIDKTDVVRRFRNEARVAALLQHPNIAQVFAFREHSRTKRLYLAMEFIPGQNLRDWVKEHGAMPVQDALGVALQIAHALVHLDEMNVVHRDIKPSNILLDAHGTAKLIDFGLARTFGVAEGDDLDGGAVHSDLTSSGVTLGTFDYISPEQARDPRTVDSRSDIYSFGCTLYYIFTGHPPFPQGNALQKLIQHQTDKPLDVRLHRMDIPEPLTQLVNRAMHKAAEERYDTPVEMLHELEDIARENGMLPEFGTRLVGTTRWRALKSDRESWFRWETVKAHLFWLVPTLVLVAALLLLTVLWEPSGDETQLPDSPTLPPALVEPEPRYDTSR